jgi:hypothetical protein
VRILQVCPYSWSARGGVQTHVRHLSRHLSARGHEVLILAAGPLGRRAAGGEAGPNVCTVGSSIRVPFNGSVAPICLQLEGARAVRRVLLRFQPDVLGDAISAFRQALELEASNVIARHGLATALDDSGDVAGALAEARLAVGATPGTQRRTISSAARWRCRADTTKRWNSWRALRLSPEDGGIQDDLRQVLAVRSASKPGRTR